MGIENPLRIADRTADCEQSQAEARAQAAVYLREYQTAVPGCDCKRRCQYRTLCQQVAGQEGFHT